MVVYIALLILIYNFKDKSIKINIKVCSCIKYEWSNIGVEILDITDVYYKFKIDYFNYVWFMLYSSH